MHKGQTAQIHNACGKRARRTEPALFSLSSYHRSAISRHVRPTRSFQRRHCIRLPRRLMFKEKKKTRKITCGAFFTPSAPNLFSFHFSLLRLLSRFVCLNDQGRSLNALTAQQQRRLPLQKLDLLHLTNVTAPKSFSAAAHRFDSRHTPTLPRRTTHLPAGGNY